MSERQTQIWISIKNNKKKFIYFSSHQPELWAFLFSTVFFLLFSLLSFRQIKDIHHDHLVRFYGACITPSMIMFITEYCPKGSLQDILENEQFKLDWMFKFSLMQDIVRVSVSTTGKNDVATFFSGGNCLSTDWPLNLLSASSLNVHVLRFFFDCYAHNLFAVWSLRRSIRSGSASI